MFRVLSDDEVEKADKEYDKWWSKLDMSTKSYIFHFCEDVIRSKDIKKAIKEWRKQKNWENLNKE